MSHKLGICIPYRNRKEHLDKLLGTLNYPNISIHVLEQDNNDLFNRAKLFNIGVKEYLDKYAQLQKSCSQLQSRL